MKKTTTLFFVFMALIVSGCDHYSEKMAAMESNTSRTAFYQDVSNIEPAAGGEHFSSSMTFKSHLKSEYLTLASYENNVRHDYRAAKYYTNQIEKLQDGQMVYPANFNDFRVLPEHKAELEEAREDLIEALKLFNIPENRQTLAFAQGRFDCWMDRAEDRPDESATCNCRKDFENALNNLVVDPEYYEDDYWSVI